MTKDEAKLVIRILSGADSSCFHCVYNLISDFRERFPGLLSVQEIHDACAAEDSDQWWLPRLLEAFDD